MINLNELNKQEKYHLSLGRFIHEFAQIETCTQMLLWIISDSSPQTAKVVFSGVSTKAACDFIRGIYEARGEQLPELLDRALSQLTTISAVRNSIVHNGAHFGFVEGEMFSSNEIFALPNKERRIPISPTILEHLCADLRTIQCCMNAYVFSTKRPAFPKVLDQWMKGAQAPWRYKRGEQPKARKKPS